MCFVYFFFSIPHHTTSGQDLQVCVYQSFESLTSVPNFAQHWLETRWLIYSYHVQVYIGRSTCNIKLFDSQNSIGFDNIQMKNIQWGSIPWLQGYVCTDRLINISQCFLHQAIELERVPFVALTFEQQQLVHHHRSFFSCWWQKVVHPHESLLPGQPFLWEHCACSAQYLVQPVEGMNDVMFWLLTIKQKHSITSNTRFFVSQNFLV